MLVSQIQANGRLFFRLAYNILGDVEAAEDICQQVFLKALLQKDRIRDYGSLKAWLSRVVINESLQVYRQRRIEQRATNNYVFKGDSILGTHEHVDLRESLYINLAELPEKTREIVVLRIIHGLSGNEVKNLLGCSAAEISRTLHKGLEQLRKMLADSFAK